jgi:hypothetical protein
MVKFVDDVPGIRGGRSSGKRLVTDGCIEPYKQHDYDEVGNCRRCGFQRPYPAKNGARPSSSRGTRPSTATPPVAEPQITQSEMAGYLSVTMLLIQRLAVQRLPDLRPDQLNPAERQLLSEAITEELWDNQQLKKLLARAKKSKKHGKLGLALFLIAMPRIGRRLEGLGAEGAGGMQLDEEMMGELSKLGLVGRGFGAGVPEAAPVAGSGGGNPAGPAPDFMSVPVASGGSPLTDRGNGQRQVDIGGVVVEAASVRGSSPNEVGRYPMAGGGNLQEPQRDEEQPNRSVGVAAGPEAGGPQEG